MGRDISNSHKKSFLERLFWKTTSLLKIDAIAMVLFSADSYLRSEGWFLSAWKRQSIRKDGEPLPWLTYPLISFIEPRLSIEFRMFEYGCGNSTKWFANRVGHITSIEHDEVWHRMVSAELPANAEVMLEKIDNNLDYSTITFLGSNDESAYSLSVVKMGIPYDIILVDGIYRNNSVVHSVNCLTKEGIIILDNSDFVESKQAASYLERMGFRRIDFWGMCPIVSHESCTSIFYRDGNCLGI